MPSICTEKLPAAQWACIAWHHNMGAEQATRNYPFQDTVTSFSTRWVCSDRTPLTLPSKGQAFEQVLLYTASVHAVHHQCACCPSEQVCTLYTAVEVQCEARHVTTPVSTTCLQRVFKPPVSGKHAKNKRDHDMLTAHNSDFFSSSPDKLDVNGQLIAGPYKRGTIQQ